MGPCRRAWQGLCPESCQGICSRGLGFMDDIVRGENRFENRDLQTSILMKIYCTAESFRSTLLNRDSREHIIDLEIDGVYQRRA